MNKKARLGNSNGMFCLFHMLLFLLILVSVISEVSAESYTIYVKPSPRQASTSFNYVFNFTADSSCNNVLLSNKTTITTDSEGIGYVIINVSSLTQDPKYLCEYRNGALRKVHSDLPTLVPVSKFTFNASNQSLTNKINLVNSTSAEKINELNTTFIRSNNSVTQKINDINETLTATKAGIGDCQAGKVVMNLTTGVPQCVAVGSTSVTDIWVNSTGDRMTGNLNMSQHNVTNVNNIKADSINVGGNTYGSFSVDSNGLVHMRWAWFTNLQIGGFVTLAGNAYTMKVYPNSAFPSYPVFQFQGTTAQTGDLTQWINVDNSVLSVVNNQSDFGIGLTTPTAKLDVNGSTRIRQNLNMSNVGNITNVNVGRFTQLYKNGKAVLTTSDNQSASLDSLRTANATANLAISALRTSNATLYARELADNTTLTETKAGIGDCEAGKVVMNLTNGVPQCISAGGSAEDTIARTRIAEVNTTFIRSNSSLTQKANAINSSLNAMIPVGGIIMYNGTGSNLGSCWHIADGKGGAINLTDRFIVGAGSNYSIGDVGGNNSVNLTIAQIPSHTHQYYHVLNENRGSTTEVYGIGNWVSEYASGSTGGGKFHENRPLYYALAYIQRIC